MADVVIRAKGEDAGASGLLSSIQGGLVALGADRLIGGIGAVTGAMGGLIKQGFDVAASNERMELSLQSLVAREIVQSGAASSVGEAMGQAGERAAELYNWTRQLAIQSPFSQEGIAAAFKTALTYGFTSEEAQKLTQSLVDYAAATGASDAITGQMANALGQMKAKGHVAGQEILQLVNAGVPALKILADHFGKTTEEMQKMIEKGEVPAEEAIKAITDSMDKDFAGAAQRQSESLSGLLNTFQDLGDLAVSEVLGASFKELAPLASEFSGWVQNEGIPALTSFGQGLSKGVGFLANLGAGLVDVGNGQGFFNDHLLAAMEILPGSSGLILSLASAVSGTLAPALDQLTRGDIGGAIATIWAGLFQDGLDVNITNLSNGISSFFSDIMGTGPDVMKTIEGIGDTLATAFESFAPGILDNIGTIFDELGPLLAQAIETALPAIQTVIDLGAATIGGAFTLLTGGVAAGLQFLNGDTEGAMTTLGNTFTGFADGVVQVFGGESWGAVWGQWTNNFSMAGTIVGAVAGNIGSTISGMVGGAIASIGEFVSGLVSGAASAVAGFASGIAALPATASTAIGDAINSAMTAAAGALGVGKSLIDGITGGIIAGVGGAIAAITSAVNDIVAAAWAAAQGASPSKIMIGFGDEVLMAGMEVGVGQGTPRAAGAMRSAVGDVIDAATGSAAPIPLAAPVAGAAGGGGDVIIQMTVYLSTLDLSAAADELLDAVELAGGRRGLKFQRGGA